MLNMISKLEVKIEDRVYQLLCDNDSSLGELHDVLHKMKNFVIQRMQELENMQKERGKDVQS